MDDKERFDGGMKIRREVLGAAYVDRGMAGADEFMMAIISPYTMDGRRIALH